MKYGPQDNMNPETQGNYMHQEHPTTTTYLQFPSEVHIHVHMHGGDNEKSLREELSKILHAIHSMKESIMQTQAQLAADLKAASEQIAKVGTETQTLIDKVAALEAAIATAGNTTPEVDDAMAAVKAQLQIVDDKVADIPTPTP